MTTKEKILETLSLDSDDFVSGEKLAENCGISRTAVNKAINSLRNEGYQIEAVTNRGYRILALPDKIDGEKISKIICELGTASANVIAFDTIDSTNSEAKRRAAAVGAFRDSNGNLTQSGAELHRTLFISGEQTAGRGRMGRVFASPVNSGIYFTLVYSPKKGVENPALFTAAAAVSVSRAIEELYGVFSNSNLTCGIKWVNDIFLGGKKICGILTEGIANFETGRIDAAIVGIGINVRPAGFSGELAKVAGNIEEIYSENCGKSPKLIRGELAAHVIHHLLDFYDAFDSNSQEKIDLMLKEYGERSILKGKTVTVNPAAGLEGEIYRAKVIGISPQAELIVETENGNQKNLHSGEVSLHSYDFV